jgi:hypothetical protein
MTITSDDTVEEFAESLRGRADGHQMAAAETADRIRHLADELLKLDRRNEDWCHHLPEPGPLWSNWFLYDHLARVGEINAGDALHAAVLISRREHTYWRRDDPSSEPLPPLPDYIERELRGYAWQRVSDAAGILGFLNEGMAGLLAALEDGVRGANGLTASFVVEEDGQ